LCAEGLVCLYNCKSMGYFAEHEELLDRKELESLQRAKLRRLLEEILPRNPFYQNKLARLSVDSQLCDLPFTTRDELQRDQAAHPPYGTNLSYPLSRYSRLHQTSGSTGQTLRILDRVEDWAWWKYCWGIIFRAAGVGPDDRLAFPFSFGPFVGFWAAFEGASALGNLCLAAGGMSTKARLQYFMENAVTVLCCTPTYALRMVEVAEQEGLNIASGAVRALIVAGEPGGNIPSIRNKIETAWGARVFDHAGMTEIGPHSFECAESPGSLHVLETEFISEVIDPLTLAPATEGQNGELVLTNLGRWGSPLLRYRTGDLVKLAHGKCVCGRSFVRLEGGLLGRIDDMVTIRGNNVFPSAIESIVREFPSIAEYRIRVRQNGILAEMEIEIETETPALEQQLAQIIRDRLHFRPLVLRVPPGSLPRFEMKARRWEKSAP
jgi:phenylacetate-CoA ligase